MESIRKFRKQRKISQSVLAKEIGVSLRTIQHYEKGDTDIPMSRVRKMASYFGVEVEDMVSESPDSPLTYKTAGKSKKSEIPTEELVRYIMSHEREIMENKTFKMWIETKAHKRMTELYQDELQKLKK